MEKNEWQMLCLDVLREKYAKGEEKKLSGSEMMVAIRKRVAKALAKQEKDSAYYEPIFFKALRDGFIPAGRINSVAGTKIKEATMISCFIQPVGDSISSTVNGKAGIYPALREAAETMRRGGGVGYDFSSIRPAGAKVFGTDSTASGPLSYMHVFDKSCSTIESAGSRRGAQMGVLRCDHPDVLQFVAAKRESGVLTNFNLSVGVTDQFMQCLADDALFELVHRAEPGANQKNTGSYQRADGFWVYEKIRARVLWEAIINNAYNTGEPGLLFLDRINQENNLYYCENIEAANPCNETPCGDYGCCCLGSINLTLFIENAFRTTASFNFKRFGEIVQVAVRMLDDVLDASIWPLPQQAEEAMSKRRIGLGFTGLGDALIMLGMKYDTRQARDFAGDMSRRLRDAAYRSSIELAKEKGAFPKLEADKYLKSRMAKRLPEEIRADIKKYGIRNSHLLSIAPAGTISLAFCDNCSNGIEPAFAWIYKRSKLESDGSEIEYEIEDHAYRLFRSQGGNIDNLPEVFVSAWEIDAKDHLLMQAAVQPYVCASISKTVNVPVGYPFSEFKELYWNAWKLGLKGVTTYRPNIVHGSLLYVD